MIQSIRIFFLAALLCAALPLPAQEARPVLQILNGSQQTLDVFWLKSDAERVANGSIAPGKETTITTTLGHRFALVGRDDQTERTVTSEVPVQGVRFDPPSAQGVPAFYTQTVSAGGFPIVASAKVNPYALKEAAYLVEMMIARRPDVRDAMIKSGARMCIIGWDEFTTDLPEFAQFKPKDFWDARARGTGGSATDPYCTSAEENLLAYPGDPYATECILIHEFAHNIHLRGMANVDPTFDGRVQAAYDAAMKAGLWKGKYASVNHHEYFAEGVQSWFDNNREPDHDHNHVNTRAELLEYDPGLAALCREVFGDTELKYTKPATRLSGHLAGYDPATAPTFVWPERLQKAKAEIRAKAEARSKRAASADGPDTREISGWTLHINRKLLTPETEPATTRALELLKVQLDEIRRVVPAAAVAELQKVPLYFSPKYPNAGARAEYHPGADWLRENGRDPVMEKGVEFTDIPDFEAETRRMPAFALHELAHAYHDRFLPGGFYNPEIKRGYDRVKAAGKYERVERQDSEGRKRTDRHYALTNPQEFFAESTEAYFGRNDFFPYDRAELEKHDPETAALIGKLWNSSAKTGAAGPLKVFVLAGQSNMQGHAKISTFEHIGMDPATKPMLAEMLGADGKPKVCERVWISSIGCAEAEQTGRLTAGFGASREKIGPEFTFGITMEKFTDAPILLIKTSWGGKSLNTNFRPPSAGPYVFNEAQLAAFAKKGKDVAAMQAEKERATGVNYRLMIEHVKSVLGDLQRVVPDYDATQGYELAGFAWFQGWNDMVDGDTYPQRDQPGGYDAYATAMAHFIRDVRRDLGAPKLPFVIGVLGVGGPTAEYGPDEQRYKATHQNFRDAMATPALLPEFKGNVATVLAEKYWDRELKAARAKEGKMKEQAKEGNLPPAEEKAALEKLRAEGLTERERLVLEKGISNFEFHYLGSAKILGGIGVGLAEAMAGLVKGPNR